MYVCLHYIELFRACVSCICIKLYMCADECVPLMHVHVCVRQMARVPSTPMFERRSCRRIASLALRVCSVRGCVSSLRVCAVAACFLSAATGNQCCGPDGSRRRALRLTWEPPRRAHEEKDEALWDFMVFFFLIQGYSWAESDSRADSLLLLLPNQRQLSLPEGALLHSVGVFENYTHSVRLHDT